ncbi:MAG: ABC transporter ATP-binding protein/permease [Oribacterium sp.]
MIKLRLIRMAPGSMKHVGKKVLFQWISLAAGILFLWNLTSFLWTLREQRVGKGELVLFLLLSLGAGCLRHCCAAGAAREGFLASREIKNLLRDRIYRKLLEIGERAGGETSSAELLQNAIDGVEQLESYFSAYLPQLFYAMLSALTLFFVVFRIQPRVALLLLLCVPLVPLSIIAVQKLAGRIVKGYWGQYLRLSDRFLENLQGFTTLKIYQADEERHRQMNLEAERFRKATMRMLMMQLNSIAVMDLIAYGGAGIGTILAVRSYAAGEIGFSGAAMILLLSAEFFLPLRMLGSYFHVAMNGIAASERIFRLLEEAVPADSGLRCESFDISARGLSFSYPDGKEAVRDLTLEIPKGSFAALVGRSGCGKSTAAALLAGHEPGYQGTLCLGRTELRTLDRRFVRERITLLGMQNYIFKGTIGENLKIGKQDASSEEMRRVLERVRLPEFAERLDWVLAEGGSNLSGGQRQRIALARALLHESEIYIFDEATSNVDVESEEAVLSVLHELAGEKTVLLISHRLANVAEADRIFVMEEGRLMEEGTHETLLRAGGIYAGLWKKQAELESYRRSGQ